MYQKCITARMNTLKSLCDTRDFHGVLEIVGKTIQEMRNIFDPNFNHSKVLFLVNLIQIYVSRFMWGDAINTIGKINAEINIEELAINNRIKRDQDNKFLEKLNFLPFMEIKSFISSLL